MDSAATTPVLPARGLEPPIITADMPRRGWRESAACRGMDPDLFDVSSGGFPHRSAVEACFDCPVRGDCAVSQARFEVGEPRPPSTLHGGMVGEARRRWLLDPEVRRVVGPRITLESLFPRALPQEVPGDLFEDEWDEASLERYLEAVAS